MKQKYEEFRKEPIKENCIVFESFWGRSYGCNPAALYEYINEHHPEYECVWSLIDTDTPVPGSAKKVGRESDDYYYYLATAKYFVYNTNLPAAFVKRKEQVVVHTMHGTPFKTFGLDVREELPSEKEELRVISRSLVWDFLLAQGEFTKNMAWRWFRYDNTVLEDGYPRTDVLYKKDEEAMRTLKCSLGIPEGKKVILYAPTWRDMDRFEMMLDLGLMRRELSDTHVLLIRPHYFVAEFYQIPEDGEFIFDGGKDVRIEDLYKITDILITDYSSAMFDFALTGKPMIFFTYDLEKYTGETRGTYFDITTEAPGTIAMTAEEVVDAIKDPAKHLDQNHARIDHFNQKYLTYENPDSTARVFEEVFIKGPGKNRAISRNRALWIARRVLSKKKYAKLKEKVMRKMLHKTCKSDMHE